jgi:hypothetical protein
LSAGAQAIAQQFPSGSATYAERPVNASASVGSLVTRPPAARNRQHGTVELERDEVVGLAGHREFEAAVEVAECGQVAHAEGEDVGERRVTLHHGALIAIPTLGMSSFMEGIVWNW